MSEMFDGLIESLIALFVVAIIIVSGVTYFVTKAT